MNNYWNLIFLKKNFLGLQNDEALSGIFMQDVSTFILNRVSRLILVLAIFA